MLTCEYDGVAFAEPRSHPWSDTAGNPECRYYDLTASPELIRTALEDFRPWADFAAIDTFYRLLEILNRTSSALETNDCAFDGPRANEDPSFPKSLQCSGRLMVLFRELSRNTVPGEMEHLTFQLHRRLAEIDTALKLGVIGTTLVPVRYLALPETDRHRRIGAQLMICFWAWGNSEAETMRNLKRLFRNLTEVLTDLSVP